MKKKNMRKFKIYIKTVETIKQKKWQKNFKANNGKTKFKNKYTVIKTNKNKTMANKFQNFNMLTHIQYSTTEE